ncbi:calmodulin-binding protein 25-like [Curcuma longa]|uniref:calmodulin-binding protein 25-like n=1 Tax=Curcuma longa TaxID=136217 RepID=UPI003D9E0B09
MAEGLLPSIYACIENDALAGATGLPLLSGPSSAVASSPPGFLSSSPFLLPLPLAGSPPLRLRDHPPSGRIGKKRKPRACKRSPTTYIAADPANFLQMVQQVTGVDVRGGTEGTRAQDPPLPAVQGSGFVPTQLDVSACLLNRLEQDTATGPADGWVFADLDPIVALPGGPPAMGPGVVN